MRDLGAHTAGASTITLATAMSNHIELAIEITVGRQKSQPGATTKGGNKKTKAR